jgi:glucoamylase
MTTGGVEMMRRSIGAAGFAALAVAAAAAPAAAKPEAVGAPGAKHTWAPADKHGFATARQVAGNAYLTLRQASASEIAYPDLSTPAFRSLQFAVTDGRTFVDRETVEDDPRGIEPVAPGVRARVRPMGDALGFTQVTRTRHWKLTKTWITDPRRPSVLVRVRFESRTGAPLRLYVLADPAPGDDGNDDTARSLPHRLVASDDDAASVVAAQPALSGTTSGYRGRASDPWRQLHAARALRGFDARERGNVVQGARTALTGRGAHRDMTLTVAFGRTRRAAGRTATRSLGAGFGRASASFEEGWRGYLASLKAPPAGVAGDPRLLREYRQSLLVLAGLEDKVHRGASVAAPNMPWVWAKLTLEKKEISGPYHLVWPRDFYHAATAQQAAGDTSAPQRMVDYLWAVQKRDGSWWQNTRANGRKYWTSLQMDEVALPVVLAWWLGRTGAADWRHVQRAADFIVAKGPYTEQERWENQDGWSPNTIAAEIAGLVCAADVARRNGAPAKAARYLAVADRWQRQVESWTATRTGPYSPRPYYLRIVKGTKAKGKAAPRPDQGTKYSVGDNFPREVDQREVVDDSFLGLTLFGVKRWDDPTVLNSLQVADRAAGARGLAVDGPAGTLYRRFSFDGYGEQADGALWTIFEKPRRQTFGRAWPLLSGERGEYDLTAGRPAAAAAALRTIARTANDGGMLPEQVWDGRPPRNGRTGRPTRSATPLAWTHAQFVRLAWSVDAGEPVERPSIVACRYTGAEC